MARSKSLTFVQGKPGKHCLIQYHLWLVGSVQAWWWGFSFFMAANSLTHTSPIWVGSMSSSSFRILGSSWLLWRWSVAEVRTWTLRGWAGKTPRLLRPRPQCWEKLKKCAQLGSVLSHPSRDVRHLAPTVWLAPAIRGQRDCRAQTGHSCRIFSEALIHAICKRWK